MSASFDALKYFEDLKAAGMPEQLARVQADAMRDFSNIQDTKNRQELATKGDIIQVKSELREVELRLQKEIQQTKYDLLKWQIGGWIALAAIMARGFGWLGF